jgi:hypothetical protein
MKTDRRSASIHRFALCILISTLIVFLAVGCKEDVSAGINGRLYTQWFYKDKLDLLWDHFTDDEKLVYQDIDTLAASREEFINEFGKETGVVSERVISVDQMRLYERVATFDKSGDPVMLQWTLDSSKSFRIALFEVRALPPEGPSDFLDYKTKTELHLPFEGQWFVLWGGRSIADNYHADTPNQRFAYDFMVVENGKYFKGDGSNNEDYLCFGKKVLAPGAGIVLEAENSIIDNTPPEENWDQPLGNHVVIDHGNGEYSLLAHLKQGTVAVLAGDSVVAGQLLGLCGNSGGSDLPHLHFHMQNTPDILDIMGAQGLPAQFLNYQAGGKAISSGEPVHGQKVSNR